MAELRVRKAFMNPDFSAFTKECVQVGECLESLGYELQDENYSQGEQVFNFRKDSFYVTVTIGEA